MLTYANFIMVKNLRNLNFNFLDVTFSPTLTFFFYFLTISKINIKLSNDIKFMKKIILIHSIIKTVHFTSLKKLNKILFKFIVLHLSIDNSLNFN